jgi:PKD repeat protein
MPNLYNFGIIFEVIYDMKKIDFKKLIIVVSFLLLLPSVGRSCLSPAVNFEVRDFCFGSVTKFNNKTKTIGNVPVYLWTIQGSAGSTPIYSSSDFDISYNFQNIGSYTVTLKATNPDGHFAFVSRVLTVTSSVKANFEYSNCDSYFTNYTSCGSTYFWDFGDSTTSTEESPKHAYKTGGVYRVRLIAYNGSDVDSMSKDLLAFTNNLDGNFYFNKVEDTLKFVAMDSVNAGRNEYHWSWGDGTSSTYFGNPGIRTTHVYKKLGRDTVYSIMLLVRSQCYSAYSMKQHHIKDSIIVSGTKVFPNPMLSSNLLRILTENDEQLSNLTITDLAGRKLSQYQIDVKPNGIDVGFNDLPSGVYYLQFKVGLSLKSYKIIRQ